jgi:F0F1-type ATP synthase membrane subunit b/b'
MLAIDGTLLVTFAVVWILVAFLTRFFFHPLQKIRAEREARLGGDREASRHAADESAKDMIGIEKSLKAARAAADKIRDDLEVEALREKTRLLSEVGLAAKAEVDKAKDEMAAEIESLKAKLAGEAQALSESIEARLLQ